MDQRYVALAARRVSLPFFVIFCSLAFAQETVSFARGDANADSRLDIADPVFILRHLFDSGDPPPCQSAADANDNSRVEIGDPVFILAALFQGMIPASPLGECGFDLTPDELACDAFQPCQEFERLIASYDLLTTVAGSGFISGGGVNGWDPAFDGAPAGEVELSRPHHAIADDAGNIYIADKDAHAIRKITLDGRLATVAGTNVAGYAGDEPGPATERPLASPNGLWVRGDGTFYILDLGNGKVRRVGTDGVMTTLFAVPGGISVGRGLWVSDGEDLASGGFFFPR